MRAINISYESFLEGHKKGTYKIRLHKNAAKIAVKGRLLNKVHDRTYLVLNFLSNALFVAAIPLLFFHWYYSLAAIFWAYITNSFSMSFVTAATESKLLTDKYFFNHWVQRGFFYIEKDGKILLHKEGELFVETD